MPQKHSNKPPARVKPKKAASKIPRARKKNNPFIPTAQDDAARKLRALEKIGANYFKTKPRKPLRVGKLTPSQIKQINTRFASIQKHGTTIKGKVVRPFKPTLKGYTLNKPFKLARGKLAHETVGAIRTHKGAIVVSTESKPRIRKDGTVITKRSVGGKEVTVYSGALTHLQTLAFIYQVENGTFKFPKGMRMELSIFNNSQSAVIYHTVEQLQRHFLKYAEKLEAFMAKNPQLDSPLTLEFYK